MPSAPASLPLVLVVPVYNEQDCIVAVLEEWREMLQREVGTFAILVVDDGSKDDTPKLLANLAWPELRVHRHTNRGHGQSCLVGYQLAAEMGAERVFQIDSDGQCEPAAFARVWRRRDEAVAVYGRRVARADGQARRLISSVLRRVLRFAWHTELNDSNVPFRLYRAAEAAEAAKRVPPSFDLANIAVALLLEPKGFVEEPIPFRDRTGGHPSVKWMGFARKARRLLADLKTLRHA